eukprot:Seg3283.4 transcript_id=Seg3283.4/GoldUCD/mRNA.D3Y31 product="Meiotic recombination protein REC114" protein_id=Seg3283.4/GoldUCD/D3Y31
MADGAKTWLIEKYARFVPVSNKEKNNENANSADKQDQSQGEWKVFTSYGSSNLIKIALAHPLKLLITSGDSLVLESLSLHGYEKVPWIKAICRGDSMLFIYRIKETARRFRIIFAKDAKASEKENCKDFVQIISKHIQVKIVDTQGDDANSQASESILADCSQTQTQLSSSLEYEYMPATKSQKIDKDPKSTVPDAHIFGTKSIRQLTDSLMKNSMDSLPQCYKSTNMIPENENIDNLVKSCILDPNFPAFVAKVEESMKRLLSE